MWEAQKKYYKKNKTRCKKIATEWRKKNPERFKELQVKSQVKHYERILWHAAKQRAELRGIPFEIEVSDVVIPEVCPYLQVPITRIRKQGRVPTNPSIDRIEPNKGYVPGNIEVISDQANRMKQDSTPQQLITFAKSILKRLDNGG